MQKKKTAGYYEHVQHLVKKSLTIPPVSVFHLTGSTAPPFIELKLYFSLKAKGVFIKSNQVLDKYILMQAGNHKLT